ncbi:MAG: GNAT family N-acetyltransferase [Elusimicrobia bacterium]|nr:GNAT family N-acetyltransferase [Elusimicrobiota bacterium]
MKTLRTERLVLRPLRDEDRAALAALLGDPGRAQYLFSGTAMPPQKAEEFIDRHFTGEDSPNGLGVLVAAGLIRFAGLIPTRCLGQDDCEFGFALRKEAEGHDYATEIGFHQMRYAFAVLGLPRVLALAHPDNEPSVHILEAKLQMRRVASLEATTERGQRIVFCRQKQDGLPRVHGKGWTP